MEEFNMKRLYKFNDCNGKIYIMKSIRLNSMDGTNLCMEKLNNSITNLERALEIIIENNANGKQFDYCNCPELANATDRLEELVSVISKKVYQKGRE